jgi:hypothetical protein
LQADECGMFYSLLLDKTYAFKDESCHGGKDRITVPICANMNGSEKMPLLITEVRDANVLQACEVPATYIQI